MLLQHCEGMMPESPALATLKVMLQEVASGKGTIGDVLAALDDSLGRALAAPICVYCGEEHDSPMLYVGSCAAHATCVIERLAQVPLEPTSPDILRAFLYWARHIIGGQSA